MPQRSSRPSDPLSYRKETMVSVRGDGDVIIIECGRSLRTSGNRYSLVVVGRLGRTDIVQKSIYLAIISGRRPRLL